MFLNKICKNEDTIENNSRNIELILKVFSKTFRRPKTSKIAKQLRRLRKIKVYKYQKLKQSELKLKTNIFKYIIGLRKTSTNIYYNVAKINGEVIVSNTKNRILAEVIDPTQNPNTRKSDLYYMIKAIKRETKNKMKRSFPCVLQIQNFRRYVIKTIYKDLKRFCNIKAVVVTNTNPHNGCRPPKIKTNTKLRFSRHFRKIKVIMTKNYTEIHNRKNPNIIYIPRKLKKEWLRGLKR